MARKQEQLSARVEVEDKASKKFETISKSIQKQNNELMRMKVSMEKLRTQSNKRIKVDVDTKPAENNVKRLVSVFNGLHRSINDTIRISRGLGGFASNLLPNPTTLALGGIGGVVGGGYLGKQVFDKTFLNAANYEMSSKTIQAMFNDKKKSDLYMKEMQKIAIGSPLLNSQDIFGNSKSFIALSKNQGQLNKMWDLAERLLAVDPKQGIEGSVFGLRELFSGDSRSLAERFELSKKVLNDIKNLPLEQQLKELDKYFNKMGMTKKLVNEMGDTTLGVWNQIKETVDVANRKMGDPAVKIIKPLLDDINRGLQDGKGSKFEKIGQNMVSGIAKGFVSSVRGAGNWIESIYNDPQFQKLNSISAKVNFVFEDINGRFKDWLGSGGQDKINATTKSLIQIMASGTLASKDILVETFSTIGTSVGEALVSKADEELRNWMRDSLANFKIKIPFFPDAKPFPIKVAETAMEFLHPKKTELPIIPNNKPAGYERGNNHAFGLTRVPRNNYPAILHEGERVLTKQQNTQSKQTPQINININNPIVREESDIKNLADKVASVIENKMFSSGGIAAW